jgi:preprotein translocase subunit SecD
MRYVSQTLISAMLIIAILLVIEMGDGALQTAAMAALTATLGIAVDRLFSARERQR